MPFRAKGYTALGVDSAQLTFWAAANLRFFDLSPNSPLNSSFSKFSSDDPREFPAISELLYFSGGCSSPAFTTASPHLCNNFTTHSGILVSQSSFVIGHGGADSSFRLEFLAIFFQALLAQIFLALTADNPSCSYPAKVYPCTATVIRPIVCSEFLHLSLVAEEHTVPSEPP